MIHRLVPRVLGAAALCVALVPAPAVAGPQVGGDPACAVPADVTARIGETNPSVPHEVDIYRPSDGRRVPAVVLVHGGAWRDGYPGKMCKQGVYLARNGIAAISITYTLSSETSPSWPIAYEDVVDTVRFVADHSGMYNIDTTRLGMYGVSAGGHLSAMVSTRNQELRLPVVLAVSVSGPMDLTLGPRPAEQQLRDLTRFLGCNPFAEGPGSACFQTAQAASPVTHVSREDPRLVLLQGTGDQIVPANQATKMAEALRAVGARHALHVVDSSAHAAAMECVPVTRGGEKVIDVAVTELGTALLGATFRPTGDYCP